MSVICYKFPLGAPPFCFPKLLGGEMSMGENVLSLIQDYSESVNLSKKRQEQIIVISVSIISQ